MKILVAYDSAYGNTEIVARHIGTALGPDAAVRLIGTIAPAELAGTDLFIAGSPTQGGQATQAMREWLSQLPDGAFNGMRVAAFDTRLPVADQNVFLRTLLNVIGCAAPKIRSQLIAKGGAPVGEAAGFLVEGKEGPLRVGQAQAAERWALGLTIDADPSRRAA